jgi:hypothetical protein
VLASDEMAGRNAGLAGSDRAALYLADSSKPSASSRAARMAPTSTRSRFRLRSDTGDGHTQNVVALWRGSDPSCAIRWC